MFGLQAPASVKPFGCGAWLSGHPLGADLIGAWLLNEQGGDVVQESTRGQLATRVGTQYWGRDGLTFANSISDHWDAAAAACVRALDNPNQITVAARVFIATSAQSGIFEKTIGGTVNSHYSLFLDNPVGSTNNLNFRVIDNAAAQKNAVSGTNVVTQGLWDFAGTYDGANIRCFANGIVQNTTAATNPPATGNGVAQIGSLVGFYGFSGSILHVMVWRRALTQAEIMDLHIAPYAMFGQPSQMWWPNAAAAGGTAFPHHYYAQQRAA